MVNKKPKFTFVDLFAGIGGVRTAFENAGGNCLFSSDWDKYAQLSYEANTQKVGLCVAQDMDCRVVG